MKRTLLILQIIVVLVTNNLLNAQTIFVNTNGRNIYNVNVSTCSSTHVASTGVLYYDIAICSGTPNIIYAIDQTNIYQIDLTTGIPTLVNDQFSNVFPGVYLNSLVCDGNGMLYAAASSSSGLYGFNLSTSTWSYLSNLGGYYSGGDLTFYNGTLYLSTSNNSLIQISSTYNSTFIGNLSVPGIYGVVTTSSNALCNYIMLATGGSNIYTLDANNGNASISCSNVIPNGEGIYGAASISEGLTNSSITVTPASATICNPGSTLLTAFGATTYSWTPSTGLSSTIGSSVTANPTVTTIYSVTGTTTGCSGVATATVTVSPSLMIAVNSATICSGEMASLIASGGTNYIWSTGETTNVISVSAAGTYSVTGSTNACSGSGTGTVTLSPSLAIAVNSATICSGEIASLIASGGTNYIWSTGETTNAISVSAAGTYSVTGSTNTCSGSGTGTVTLSPSFMITVNSATICSGQSALLTASGANSYLWSNGDVVASIIVSPTNNTTYTVSSSNAAGCSAKAIGTVTVFPNPQAQFSPFPNPAGISNPLVTFNDQSSGNVNYWFWSFGDGDTLAPNTASPAHTYPSVETTYTVTLTVHNVGLCFDTISHQVVIGSEYAFYIPNAFTPDGDGINDVFFGKGAGIFEFEIMIFDRWGNFIFSADDINKAWDGKVNGGDKVAQHDVYVWKVALTDVYKKKHNYIGTVTIVKGQ